MNVLLTSLNSKYIHTNLAIRYLKTYCKHSSIELEEYTINDNTDSIVGNIFFKQPDIVAFSCYIWNIQKTIKVVHTLKKANKNIKIILGGPEVSYDPEYFLKNYPEIDFIVSGEGEQTFKELLESLINNNDLDNIKGLAYRKNNKIIVNDSRDLISDLDIIDFPYDDLDQFKNKIAYCESSRGCPFNCQYCLSSTIHNVRYFSMNRVKKDLKKLIDAGVSQIKFIDRTFNCNKSRTIEILKYILDLNPNINFHFEINAELVNEEILKILNSAPEGLFQFEIGVQSTNPETLDAINRKSDFKRLSKNVREINKQNNIHLHLDLIAGLPKESYKSFGQSFNDVYKLKPQKLQLGFLKLLRGSELRLKSNDYGIKYNHYPPYEVVSTNDISFDELVKLKDIEECLEKYYNSKRFYKSLDFVINNHYNNSFEFFEHFSEYWRNNNLFNFSHSSTQLYTIFWDFYKVYCCEKLDLFNELLKFDYLLNHNSYTLPEGLTRNEYEIRKQVFEFLKQPENIDKFLPQYSGMPAKKIIKKIHIETFKYNILLNNNKNFTVILFDYSVHNKTFKRSNAYDITNYIKIN